MHIVWGQTKIKAGVLYIETYHGIQQLNVQNRYGIAWKGHFFGLVTGKEYEPPKKYPGHRVICSNPYRPVEECALCTRLNQEDK